MMITVDDYLNLLKDIKGVSSDYAVAKKIGTSKQNITNWRHNERAIAPKEAIKIAEAIGCNPIEIVAISKYYKESDEEEKEFWFDTYKKYNTAENTLNLINKSKSDVNIKNENSFNNTKIKGGVNFKIR